MKKSTCTSCNTRSALLHGERWNCELGFIIKPGENLCDDCAEKRVGYKTLNEINSEFNSKLSIEHK